MGVYRSAMTAPPAYARGLRPAAGELSIQEPLAIPTAHQRGPQAQIGQTGSRSAFAPSILCRVTKRGLQAPSHLIPEPLEAQIPYLEPSLPCPEYLTPPNGATSVEISPSLIPTIPYSNASATFQQRATF